MPPPLPLLIGACTIVAVGGTSAALTNAARTPEPAPRMREPAAASRDGRLVSALRALSCARLAAGALVTAVAAMLFVIAARPPGALDAPRPVGCYTAADRVTVYLALVLGRPQ